MSRFTILASLCACRTMTGCSGRVSHEEAKPSGSSTTIVEVSPLDSPPPPAEPPSDAQPPIIDQEGIDHVIVFGDVEQHHHLHSHEAPEPPSLRVDVRVEADAIDDRDRRRRMVEQRLAELLDRR